MEDFKKLYFHLFGRVAEVIEEYDKNLLYREIVAKLKEIELETEDMYMDMPSDEDEVVEDDEQGAVEKCADRTNEQSANRIDNQNLDTNTNE